VVLGRELRECDVFTVAVIAVFLPVHSHGSIGIDVVQLAGETGHWKLLSI
jgi:hypothetical protein